VGLFAARWDRIGVMQVFEDGKAYRFTRRQNGIVEVATFTKFEDGSAYVESAEFEIIYEWEDDSWLKALQQLADKGFILEDGGWISN